MVLIQLLAALVTTSASIITLPDLIYIRQFMRKSLHVTESCMTKPRNIVCKLDIIKFSSTRELLAMAYYPYSNPEFSCVQPYYSERHQNMCRDLEQKCIEAGLANLYIALTSDEDDVDNDTVDFVTCLPWYLHQGSRAQQQACKLVAHLGEELQLQPPSLLNIAKARLASMHFGLKKVLKVYSIQDLNLN